MRSSREAAAQAALDADSRSSFASTSAMPAAAGGKFFLPRQGPGYKDSWYPKSLYAAVVIGWLLRAAGVDLSAFGIKRGAVASEADWRREARRLYREFSCGQRGAATPAYAAVMGVIEGAGLALPAPHGDNLHKYDVLAGVMVAAGW